jgi:hypothetical protein
LTLALGHTQTAHRAVGAARLARQVSQWDSRTLVGGALILLAALLWAIAPRPHH